jgi:hypothetical protein
VTLSQPEVVEAEVVEEKRTGNGADAGDPGMELIPFEYIGNQGRVIKDEKGGRGLWLRMWRPRWGIQPRP